jgi:hypothetical protein
MVIAARATAPAFRPAHVNSFYMSCSKGNNGPQLVLPVLSNGVPRIKFARRNKYWVKSGHRNGSAECPLYPQKRTLLGTSWMSALCQKWKSP